VVEPLAELDGEQCNSSFQARGNARSSPDANTKPRATRDPFIFNCYPVLWPSPWCVRLSGVEDGSWAPVGTSRKGSREGRPRATWEEVYGRQRIIPGCSTLASADSPIAAYARSVRRRR